MKLWLALLAAEIDKLRRLVVLRAVAVSLLLGPGLIVLVLRLVAPDIRRVVASPLEVVLGTVVLLSGFGSVVLAASLLGSEFDLGTARLLLLRGASRSGLLLAKAAGLLAVTAGACLLACAVALIETLMAGWTTDIPEALAVLGRSLALVLLVSLAYSGFTFLGAILGGSTAAGMLAGLTLFLGDFLLTTLNSRLPLAEWLPVANLFSLLGGTFSFILPADSVSSPAAAALRLAVFGAGTVLAGTILFARRDVHH